MVNELTADILGQSAQISVKWDNGRNLMLCFPEDAFQVIEHADG